MYQRSKKCTNVVKSVPLATLVHLRQVHPLVGTAFLLYPRSLLYYYSPTEHAEFTEPSAAMFSHGYHRCTQMVMVR